METLPSLPRSTTNGEVIKEKLCGGYAYRSIVLNASAVALRVLREVTPLV
jgi:hypothetical protein